MAERLKAHAWKACIGNPYPGFESLSLRTIRSEALPWQGFIFYLAEISDTNLLDKPGLSFVNKIADKI